jgi:DNA-directed RNA polymerase subunit beta'
MADASQFAKIRIGIASPDEIRAWSYGEVKKPETINYRTFKPERDGLFCEKIFGPVKDWECHCGRYKKVKFKGVVCDRCGVEVTRSKVRRERMGHIELAAPVCHIWYLKGVPSPLALILDISPRLLEKVLYFASYIVTDVDRARINNDLEKIKAAVAEEQAEIAEERSTIADRLTREHRKEVARHTTDLDAAESARIGTADNLDVTAPTRGGEPKFDELNATESAPEEGDLEPGDEEPAATLDDADIDEPEDLVALEDGADDDEDVDGLGEVDDDLVPPVERWDEETLVEKEKNLVERIKQEERDATERLEDLDLSLELLTKIEKRQLIGEDQYRSLERLLDVLSRRLGEDYGDLVKAGLGGAAVKKLLDEIDLEKLLRELEHEVQNTQGPRRVRAIKRLEVTQAFLDSKAHPSWMILECIPVISPELRPMVQLDGGRFATSDLNDLYRRIINRNNRLKKITDIRAPESIVNHEKRLLQEAVDALIDNGRRSRPVVGSTNRPLKSLSDMLKGKEGRFRKNLLGKRVDYSGRSVIVVGPHLKLHQCGLPKEMALELFKPFVMKALVERGYTTNIKSAKRMIDKMKPEVWDALEEVISEHPVLLNRAPTLHRLGIQAFEPVLVDGKAIQIHPLVCHAFNADFDGDQMAVHVPLSAYAQAEARVLMLSTHNLFSPANGNPIVAPTQDIVLGAYYLTTIREGEEPFGTVFASPEEAIIAYEAGEVDMHAPIRVRIPRDGRMITVGKDPEVPKPTTVGRLLLNEILPEGLKYTDKYLFRTATKKTIAEMVDEVYKLHGKEVTINFLDDLKNLGFRYATRSGVTISMTDMDIPAKRDEIMERTETAVKRLTAQYGRGTITEGERRRQVIDLWMKASEEVAEAIMAGIDRFNPIYLITDSGARGSSKQITQLSGMRGLMADPFGNLIEDLPIKSNFHEGLNVLEYFVSTHGARKGLADTALRTADAGYLTRRLVDVAQDVIVRAEDCETANGIYVQEINIEGDVIETLAERIRGRFAIEDVLHPETGAVLVSAGEEITDQVAAEIERAGIRRVGVRSVLTCELRQGICSKCYGRDLASGRMVDIGVAVGIIAAQSIGEPGTQLTMRTFHTGGVAGKELVSVANVRQKRKNALRELQEDIRQGHINLEEEGGSDRERARSIQALLKVSEDQVRGLLRVVELFEARKPKGQAIVTDMAGEVLDIERKGLRHVVLRTAVKVKDAAPSYLVGETVLEDVLDSSGQILVAAGEEITERIFRQLRSQNIEEVVVRKTIMVPWRGDLKVHPGDKVVVGDRLTDGPLDPHRVLELSGTAGLADYLVSEIQAVYKGQGVDINDKHVEVIVRQMLRKRRIKEPGDTGFLPGQVVDKFAFDDANAAVREKGGNEATASWVLLGITEASLATDSFLSAASFQKTTRVLTEAAVRGKKDELLGLKENVIIGRLIPAGTGLPRYRSIEPGTPDGERIITETSARPERPALGLGEGEEEAERAAAIGPRETSATPFELVRDMLSVDLESLEDDVEQLEAQEAIRLDEPDEDEEEAALGAAEGSGPADAAAALEVALAELESASEPDTAAAAEPEVKEVESPSSAKDEVVDAIFEPLPQEAEVVEEQSPSAEVAEAGGETSAESSEMNENEGDTEQK